MNVFLKNGKIKGYYREPPSNASYDSDEELIFIPDEYWYEFIKINNWLVLGKPDPRNDLSLSSELKKQIKLGTLSLKRQLNEQSGVLSWNGHPIKIDLETRINLALAIFAINEGLFPRETIPWKFADNQFVDVGLGDLRELLTMVVLELESNFLIEKNGGE